MENVKISLGKKYGAVKPMHAVNNGPVYKFTPDQRETNIDAFREAGIPYARTHDAAFFATYGGEHTVDILAIFPNFDADVEDEASYDFVLTDEYMKVMEFAGVKPFYRLGSKIEHWQKKYGTLPPKDFHKWAVICEHIIKHYNYGWANGFHMNIEYWEIWNEPDMVRDDAPLVDKKTWGGTAAEFYEFFSIAHAHLKTCFPELKIGGPAVVSIKPEWDKRLFAELKLPLDFFSWHIYCNDPNLIAIKVREARELLDSCGLTETESILNEYNYVKGWKDYDWYYSKKVMKSLKGASFTAAAMCCCQREPLDMLMYYDARPCGMNGLFDTDSYSDKLKGYYPFRMFNELYKLGNAVEVNSDTDYVFACAAVSEDGNDFSTMLTNYKDEDGKNAEVRLELSGIKPKADGTRVYIYVLDAENDCVISREETLSTATSSLFVNIPIYTTVLVTTKEL